MHIEKYKRCSVGHILRHNEPGIARSYRDNVNNELTQTNYNFVSGKGIDNLKKVLSSVKVSKRKDLNILCSCCVTAPTDLLKENEKAFFQCAFDFLKKRYCVYPGSVVSAWVHNDEKSSHLHFCFVPLVYDNKKECYKVSAKELINKKDLLSLHTDFDNYVKSCLGLNLSILNGSTSQGNLSILELKEKTLQDDIRKLKKLKNNLLVEIEHIR